MQHIIMFLAAMLFCCCSADNEVKAETPTMNIIYITIDGQTQSATLVDNDATRELVAALQNAPMTALPGDIVLYNGSNICIFYESNSWSYTRLGHIDGLSESELRTFLKAGENNISVTLSLAKPTGIRGLSSAPSPNDDENYYTLNGQKVSNPSKGLFLKNGKKIVI